VDIRFTGQNLKITAGMKEHLEERLMKLERYAPRLVEAHVFLKKEKYIFDVEITVLAKDLRAFGEGTSKENVFVAMDEAYERIVKQLKKYRARRKEHHVKDGKGLKKEARSIELVEAEAVLKSERPRIVRTKDFAPKPMSPEEASLQLELSDDSFLVFLNPATDRVNVLYKREDGNHGLIEPAF
jgi:putative sigma-54 modulation protein